MEAVLALLAGALALMGSPGPATLSSAASGAAFGMRASLPYVAGISSGTATVAGAVALGLTGLVTSLPGAGPVISALAGAYILYLAWKIGTAPPLGSLDRGREAPPFIAGYLLAVVNPKAYAAMGALFSGFHLVEADPAADNFTKFLILAPLAPLINLFWMRVGGFIAARMTSPRTSRMLNIGFAVALIASVAMTLVL
ncbi:LysE family transporter [Rhodobacteraceae bacterium NNCM2]|nr:LysE family transporter [Coraliihabitans acroporae]